MARSTEIVLRDTLGNMAVQIAQLTAELEACQERCKGLAAKVDTKDA